MDTTTSLQEAQAAGFYGHILPLLHIQPSGFIPVRNEDRIHSGSYDKLSAEKEAEAHIKKKKKNLFLTVID